MAMQDMDLLVRPIQSIRLDVSQINSILKTNSSTQRSIRRSVTKLSTVQGMVNKTVDRFTRQLGRRTKQNRQKMKSFKQNLSDAVTQVFSRKHTTRDFLKTFKKQTGFALTQRHIQGMRKRYKGGEWQKLKTKFKTLSGQFAQNLKPGSSGRKRIQNGLQQIIGDVAMGLKSQLNRSLSFLPDAIKRPLVKGLGSAIDGIGDKLKSRLTNNPAMMNIMLKMVNFAKNFGLGLGVRAVTVGLLVKMFRNIQSTWVQINKTFGGFMLSYNQMIDMTIQFGMKTGQSLKQFKQNTISVIKQFGFFDKKAVQTGALVSRVFGVSTDERRKLQRIIGGPGNSITKFLDDATKRVVKFGGQGKIVFQTIIRMQQKFRSLTVKQKQDFVELASILSGIGIDSKVVMDNLSEGFGSIDKALQTTKQVNLRILQMGLNAGKTYGFLKATSAIDIYKRVRVGDLNKAFGILTKQTGPDFIKQFDNIKSSAAKMNFLKTMFGDVQSGQKIMDQMRDMMDTFGTTDVQRLKQRFSRVFDPKTQSDKLAAFTQKLKKMRMSTQPQLRSRAKRAYQGVRPDVIAKIKAEVQTNSADIKNFQDLAEATKTVSKRFEQMWVAFKSGFLKSFAPLIKGINESFKNVRTSQALIKVFASRGKFFGDLIYYSAKIAIFVFPVLKFLAQFQKSISILAFIFGKIFLPIGIVIGAIQSLFTIFQYWANTGDSVVKKIGLVMTAIIDAIISPIRSLYNMFAKGTKGQWKSFSQMRFGRKAATGDYVSATPGGVQRTVGQGGKDQIISPVPMMRGMIDRAISKAGVANSKLQSLLRQNNQLLKKVIQAVSSPVNILDGKMRLQNDVAHIVSGQIRYAMKD